MSFNITGEALIGGVAVKGHGGSFEAWDPAARAHIAPAFHMVDVAQIDEACRLAQAAFDPFRATTDAQRADFLDTIAAQIGELGDDLIVRKLKFLDGALDQLEHIDEEGRRAELDARFALQSGEIRRL
ncbi:MAG: aldehyde dehydrogenase family protein, partial [Janthinobacterium sp.]